jgi:hypothetical protein
MLASLQNSWQQSSKTGERNGTHNTCNMLIHSIPFKGAPLAFTWFPGSVSICCMTYVWVLKLSLSPPPPPSSGALFQEVPCTPASTCHAGRVPHYQRVLDSCVSLRCLLHVQAVLLVVTASRRVSSLQRLYDMHPCTPCCTAGAM